jgi:hypothetical protein
MRQRIVSVRVPCAPALLPLLLTLLLSLLACSGSPAAPAAPGTRASGPVPRASAAPGFTVTGDHPVSANGSQDTYAQAGTATCDSAQLTTDKILGNQIATGFAAADFPAGAQLLRHFLAGDGTAVNYPAGSRISELAIASGAFQAVNGQVQGAVARLLRAGDTRVKLSAGQLPTVTFGGDTKSDLYWGFRGTQGLTVTGSGSRKGGKYVGTLTYVIRDSYGFPVDDTLDGFGSPMRYLQTVCGAPQHPGGAHWFPDSIAVTVPFDQSAG